MDAHDGTTKPPGHSRQSISDHSTNERDTSVVMGEAPSTAVSRSQRKPIEAQPSGNKRQHDQGVPLVASSTRRRAHSERVHISPVRHGLSSPDVTWMEIPHCMLENYAAESGIVEILQSNARDPPVTTSTLKELDLHAIQNNVNLRIDICHDQDLFFQPISGHKGDAKRSEARAYWLALQVEFLIYLHNSQPECPSCGRCARKAAIAFQPRLASMFDHLREIVRMLVPDSDQEEVTNHLDTPLLMQQVHVGALDTGGLAMWLSKLLTSHCAPMRDQCAAEVTEQISTSSETGNMDSLVGGLEKLFGLLEAMKLDVANHQIRQFRGTLIKDTINFQQECFTKAIKEGDIDVTSSQQWYLQECSNHRHECPFDIQDQESMDFTAFVHGLVHLCDPSETKVPLTFQYDHNRFMRLREDVQDHIHVSLCLAVFDKEVTRIVGPGCDPSPMHPELKQRIVCLTEDDDGIGGAVSDHLDAIGVELARAAFSMHPKNKCRPFALHEIDFDHTICLLREVFQEEDSTQVITQNFLASLEIRTMHFTQQFKALTTQELSDEQKSWIQARIGKENLLADWNSMARKLAHIGIVHWKVWAKLCYSPASEHRQSLELASYDSYDEGIELDLDDFVEDWPASVPPHLKDCHMDLGHSEVSGLRTVATQELGASIVRQDSGFVSSNDDDDVDDDGSGCDINIELDTCIRGDRKKPSGKRRGSKTKGKRLNGSR